MTLRRERHLLAARFRYCPAGAYQEKGRTIMSRFMTVLFAGIVAVSAGAATLAPTPAAAASDADAKKQATATCKAQVKEEAQYHDMSLWARHKAVKKCVAEALAHH
jgi:hypothetical protein